MANCRTLSLMSLTLGACGSGGSTNKTATITPQQLGEALLTTSDLGTGFTETQRDVFATHASPRTHRLTRRCGAQLAKARRW